MTSWLKKFQITLEPPGVVYSPGEIVAGRVAIHLNRPELIRGIKVGINGKARVKWTEFEKPANSDKSEEVTYRGRENYFSTEILVVGQTNIQSGSHVFPFEFCLPRNIPSSFERNLASAKYEVSAVIERPGKSDHRTSLNFTVVTPYDLSEYVHLMTAIDLEEVETFCCFPLCFKVGALKLNVFVPTRCFAIGEVIRARVTMNNTSSGVDATGVELQIIQKIKYHAHQPEMRTKEDEVVVQSSEKHGPFGKNDEVSVDMKVPFLPHSKMIYCSIVDIDYVLAVIVHVSGCHCAVTRKYPIAIGAKPAPRDPLARDPTIAAPSAPLPSAPFFPGKEFADRANPEPRGLREEPPPSYNQAVGGQEIWVPYQR